MKSNFFKSILIVSILVIGTFLVFAGSFLAVAGQEQFLQGTWSDQLSVVGFPTLPMHCTYFTDLVGAKAEGTMLCTINKIELPTPNGTLVLQGTGHGAWIQKKGYEFDFTMVFFITDEPGILVGTSNITGVKHLNKSMDEYTGEGIDEIIDFDGNVMATSSWTVKGSKMVVEPLE